jgi:phosphoadenosine phosphosulfate reductase
MPPDLEHREAQTLLHLRSLLSKASAVRFASSLGLEDMVVTDLIVRHQLPIGLFTLDTGRLPEATYDLMSRARRYSIKVVFPHPADVQSTVERFGINGFYESIEARKACCAARKVEPLKRALEGADAWVTGLRREQSEGRQRLEVFETDPLTGLLKCNPLLDWSLDDVWSYVKRYQVPVNSLHHQGYPSIGCAPCTRAVAAGEPVRAGRWWWEQGSALECGLHRDRPEKVNP